MPSKVHMFFGSLFMRLTCLIFSTVKAQLRRAKKQQFQKVHTKSTRADVLAELKSCSIVRDLEWGRRIHEKVITSGTCSSIRVASALVNMYAKCGSMIEARQVFDGIRDPDVVSWTALLLGYADNEQEITALDLFSKMKPQGCAPNSRTFVAVLKACTSLALKQESSGKRACLKVGKQIHSEIGCHIDIWVQGALVDMYAKCGSMVDARQVFETICNPSVVSWNALLLGYVEAGESLTALDLFWKMKSQGCTPSSITYVAAAKACASLALEQDVARRAALLQQAKAIHSDIGCHLNSYVQTSLIDMYAKLNSMADAHKVFNNIRYPDVVSWNALLLGYADNGEGLTALDLFSLMKSQGCVPDWISFLGALKACTLLGSLELGRKVHAEIHDRNVDFNDVLVTCLLDFYAKCGSLAEAQKVFDMHSGKRSLKAWTALLAGYCSFGDSCTVFRLFDEMQDAGFQPDAVTIQCLLTSCSHASLVREARECFKAICMKYGLTPCVEHYNCMVDVLARGNQLDDVMVLLRSMPCCPDAVTWNTVLAACHKWNNVEIGTLAFQSLLSLDESNATAYIQMAHIYASSGMHKEQEMVLKMKWRVE